MREEQFLIPGRERLPRGVCRVVDDDRAKRFRENDNLGSDSNVLLRPIRHLLARGVPPGPMSALSFAIPDTGALPFGVLAWTVKNRLIFWPVLPKSWEMVNAVDHITLEFPSKRSHLTAYKASGKPVHRSAADMGLDSAWGLTTFPGTGIALWFTLAVQTSMILEQDLEIQRRVLMPTPSEKERRISEFVRHYQQLNHVSVPLPPDRLTVPRYIICNVYLVTDPALEGT